MTDRILLAASVLALSACGVPHDYEDEGRLCAHASSNPSIMHSDPEAFTAAAPVTFVYYLPRCMSSSCNVDRSAECRVTREGSVLRVTSAASYIERIFTCGCSSDCAFVWATCTTEPLEAGTYDIVHGDQRTTLTVPSEVPPPCVGETLSRASGVDANPHVDANAAGESGPATF